MPEIKALIDNIRDKAAQSHHQQITGRNLIAKKLFEFLRNRADLSCELLLLCNKQGLILDFFTPDLNFDISGHTIPLGELRGKSDDLLFRDNSNEFSITAYDADGNSGPKLTHLESGLKTLLDIYDASDNDARYLLDSFNFVQSSVAIYDKNAYLLFANSNYFQDMHLEDQDRNAIIGMRIQDIVEEAKIDLYATQNDSTSLKMIDVLKTGKKACDWEVRVELRSEPDKPKFTSYDMYPITNKQGKVEGLVELAHSRQLDLDRTKKIMGLAAEYTFDDIVGSSTAIRKTIDKAKKLANSPFNLLVLGESGVGKELFSQSIHNYSVIRKGPFVALNCASFPENLIESELFGYAGGAFTGASKNGQIGKFELANGGTLFLDEIGELPYHFQSKLLRVLETRMVTRIGSSRQTPINVRVIAATNRNLDEMVSEKLFREDLYYRLQVLSVEIPPLRKRREDIALLAEMFLKNSADMNNAPKSFDAGVRRALMEHDWPGNVRELKNVIYRMGLLANGDVITRDDLAASLYEQEHVISARTPEDRLSQRRLEVTESNIKLIREALSIADGNKTRAAELLDISKKTLYRMLEKYNLM